MAAGVLPKGVVVKVFFRSLFLQAAWNPQGMQNLGLAYTVYPALELLYPDKDKRAEAVRRHLALFNTHPYVAAAIVGGVLLHEERVARGEESPAVVVKFKAALMGPLAALGDGFFWLSLKPAVGAVCAALVPLMHAWAAVLFLVLYNLVHLTLRARMYGLGLRLGDQLVGELGQANLPAWGARLRTLAAASAGGLAARLAMDFGREQGGTTGALLAGGCLAVGVLSYWLVVHRLPNAMVLYLAAALAGAAGAFL
jgi:PTS system mannose-specific IID component